MTSEARAERGVAEIWRRLWRHRLLRYVIAGGINTGISQLFYLAGLRSGLTPGIAFACAFAVGIGIGYVLHGRVVFRAEPRRLHWVSFPAACLARFALSEALLHELLTVVTPGWAGLIVNITMVPVGYLLTRMALTVAWRSPP